MNQSRLTAEEIRAEYPNPKADKYPEFDTVDNRVDYCVGGAMCLYAKLPAARTSLAFPDEGELGRYLQYVNPLLRPDEAYDYAVEIVKANDSENFDEAWTWLDKALSV